MPHAETALCNPGPLGRMLAWVRVHAVPGSDLTTFSREELRHMAEDLSLAPSDLLAMSTGGRDNTVLMESMIRARGLDPDRMRYAFVTLLRDVERVCTQCKTTGRCRRELDAGTAATHCHDYCPNAGTFDDLVEYGGVPMVP
jgi:Family of unknown function (DUF6455)